MNKRVNSFVMVLRQRYRVFLNADTGYWFAAYNEGAGRTRVSLGVKTKPEAEVAVQRLDKPPVITTEVKRTRWSDVKEGFLGHKRSTGKAPKTITRYSAALDAFTRFLTGKKIEIADEITLPILEGYVGYRVKEESCDEKTAYTDALVIKGAFKWAARPSRKLLTANPALDWETPEPVKPKRRTYTGDEVAKLETCARLWLRSIIITLAWTGMRIDELINLRWKDVDFKQRVINIRVQESWKPKGRRDRTVPMHPKVEAALKAQRVGTYVFSGPRGGRIRESRCLACLKRDQRKHGLPECDLHGFRRYFATTMMQAGASAENVRQWGGWKSLETMLRYLADVNVKDSVQAMDQVVKNLAAS